MRQVCMWNLKAKVYSLIIMYYRGPTCKPTNGLKKVCLKIIVIIIRYILYVINKSGW